jgi:hypothetical protein
MSALGQKRTFLISGLNDDYGRFAALATTGFVPTAGRGRK